MASSRLLDTLRSIGAITDGKAIVSSWEGNAVKRSRRRFLAVAVGAAALPAAARLAWAQAYPARPVRLVVGFPPGGSADIVTRIIAQALTERMGQSFMVDNKPGAGSNIGTEAVARAEP